MKFIYRGYRWTIPLTLLLALGSVGVLGWGKPDVRSWTAYSLLGLSLGLQVMRYWATATTYKLELEGNLSSMFQKHIKKEFKHRPRTSILEDTVKDLEN